MHLLSSQSHSQSNLKHYSYQKGSSVEFLTPRPLLRMTQMSMDNRTLLWPREPVRFFGWDVKELFFLEEWAFELSCTEQALETDGWKMPDKTQPRLIYLFLWNCDAPQFPVSVEDPHSWCKIGIVMARCSWVRSEEPRASQLPVYSLLRHRQLEAKTTPWDSFPKRISLVCPS